MINHHDEDFSKFGVEPSVFDIKLRIRTYDGQQMPHLMRILNSVLSNNNADTMSFEVLKVIKER
jgi:hypothetical protein